MLVLRSPWEYQPQESVSIDWANPLTARITHLLPLNGDSRELITGQRLTYGAGGSQVLTQRGRALQGSGTAASASVPLNLSQYTKVTISFWMYWDAYSNSDNLAMEYGSSYVTDSGFLIDPNSGFPASGSFQCGTGSPAASNACSFTRPSAGEWHHYVFRFDRTTGTSLGTSVYVDGVEQTVVAAGTVSDVADSFGNNSLYLFSRNNSSLFGAGKIQNLVIRGGYLMSAPEVWQEYTSPWQLFAPGRVYIPLNALAGGAYTLNLETGVYSFTGSNATLTKNSKLTLDSGTYALSGSNASLLKGLILEAASGTYSLTGSDASVLYTHLLNSSSGSYSITGSDATLTYTPTSGAYSLNLESGAYLLTGSDVTFISSGAEVTIKAGSWIRYRIIT